MGPGSRFAWPGRQRASPRLNLARVAASSAALCIERAQGRPGADCARSTVCESNEREHTGLTGTAETSRPSPREGFAAYTCSPRGAAFLAPVTDGSSHRLDARVAAPGPHDFAVRCERSRPVKDHLTPQRPFASHRTARDDRAPPLCRVGQAGYGTDFCF